MIEHAFKSFEMQYKWNLSDLNIPGEWTPVLILFSRALFLYLEHQVLAAEIQNILRENNHLEFL